MDDTQWQPTRSSLAPSSEDEQLRRLHQSLVRDMALPADAFVIGQPAVRGECPSPLVPEDQTYLGSQVEVREVQGG